MLLVFFIFVFVVLFDVVEALLDAADLLLAISVSVYCAGVIFDTVGLLVEVCAVFTLFDGLPGDLVGFLVDAVGVFVDVVGFLLMFSLEFLLLIFALMLWFLLF